jgi:quercetin dioxygenase-like cupin family protein
VSAVLKLSEAAPEEIGVGATRRTIVDPARLPEANVVLSHWHMEPRGSAEITVSGESLAWLFVLKGEGRIVGSSEGLVISSAHTGCLAPGFTGRLESDAGMAMLHVEIPQAGRFDASFAATPPATRIVDWTREPVLHSKHDARRRIYVATPELFASAVIKAEIIFYPPATSGSNHFHEGAEHFKYVLKGSGTGYANDVGYAMRAGDVIWHARGERHYSVTTPGETMEFIEFFVPGKFGTTWVVPERGTVWLRTDLDFRGRPVSRPG